jgi:tetratricopeptide (TPR) repeat protein
MIYDNADEGYRVVEKFLPPGDAGNILITSRNRDLMRITSKENSMEVLEMGEEEALSLLAKSAMLDYTSEDVKDLAKQLVSKLGGIPLAIDQAGAYMLSCNYPLKDYLELFMKHQDQLMSDPEFRGASDYHSSTYGTWEISIKEIEGRASNKEDSRAIAAGNAITLHKTLALLHHENIPEELFKKAAENYKNRDITYEKELGLQLLVTMLDSTMLFLDERGEWDEIQFQASIRVLLSFSLIRSTGKLYSIHPLLHSWSRNRIPKTEIRNQHLITRAFLSCSVDMDDRDNHEFCAFLVPHIRASNNHATELQLKSSYYDDEFDIFAHVFHRTGSWDEAENLQHCVMEARKAKLGPDHMHTLVSMRKLGFIYKGQGRWDEVEKIQMQVMEASKEMFGEEDQFTLDSMTNLANAYWGQGRMGEAERLETQVMETHKVKLGSDHPYTLIAMESLAVTYMGQGRLVEAEQLLLYVVDMKHAVLGPKHYDTLYAMNNLATAYFNQRKWNEAMKLYFDVFEARKARFGQNHPMTLDSMGMLGSTYMHCGRVNEGQPLLSKAASLLEKTIGSKHETTLWYRKELDQLSNKYYSEVKAE